MDLVTLGLDRRMDELRQIGERNRDAIELVNNHCLHAKVEPSPLGGHGMAEGMLGLPINMRTIRCDHAAKPGGHAMNIESIAVEFYHDNCVGCPFRQARGLPNLKTHVEALDAEAQKAAMAADAHRTERLAQLAARKARRERLVAGESYATREQVALLDRVDADEPDAAAASQLAQVANAAPELFTPAAVIALSETIEATGQKDLLTALRALAYAGAVDAGGAVATALRVLAARPIVQAAYFVVDFPQVITPAMLVPVIDELVLLAGRSGYYIPEELQPDPKPLISAFNIDAPGVLARIEATLDSAEDWRAARAAQAAAAIMQVEPGAALVLAARVLDRLRRVPAGLGIDMDSPVHPLRNALTTALRVEPATIRALVERRALQFSADMREVLFEAFSNVVQDRREAEPLAVAAGAMLVEASLARLNEDWGPKAAATASDALETIARNHPELLDGHAVTIWGEILREARWRPPTSVIVDIRPDPLAFLEKSLVSTTHGTRLSRLRGTLDLLVARSPDEVGAIVIAVLSESDLAGEDVETTRAEAVRLLGALGCQPTWIRKVIPLLYSALLKTDTLQRGRAVDAWAEIKQRGPKHELPAELAALTLPLLSDPYVFVRHRMVDALLVLGLPDSDVEIAAYRVIEFANMKKDDSRTLKKAIDVLRWLASRAGAKLAQLIRRICLKLAESLNVYDLDDFVLYAADEFTMYPGYPMLVVRVLSSPEIALHADDREDRYLKLLWRVPPRELAKVVDQVGQAAKVTLRVWPTRGLRYVEVLQQAGLFSEAAALVDEIVAGVPDTTESAPQRTEAQEIQAAAHLEIAIAAGDRDRIAQCLDTWREASAAHANAMARATR